MFIKELILKNFSGIHAAMKTDYIRIDFSKRKNKICLIAGPNGHGKTVLLSQLNPFASLGNLDVRDNLPVIIPRKEGYKKIVIVDGDAEYNIEHFYTPTKETHSVKSYIKKNGIELNVNGNVSSFKEIVSLELEMELDYMKLVRLGNNVVNLISLKATERKTFMAKVLDEVNVFLLHFKKINADVLSLKTLISHCSDKLRQLPSDDIYTLKDLVSSKQEMLHNLHAELDSVKGELSVIDYSMKSIGNLEDLLALNADAKKKMEKLSKTIMKRGNDMISFDEICELEKTESIHYQELSSRIETMKTKYQSTKNILNDAMNELNRCEIELNKLESDIDVDGIQKIIFELKNEIALDKKRFDKYGDINYTKEDVEKLILILKDKQDILTTTYSFGKEPIQKVIELMKAGKPVQSYIEEQLAILDKKEDSVDAKRFARKILRKYSDIKPKCKDLSCKMFKIWDEIDQLANESDSSMDNGKDFYTYMNLAYINIKSVFLALHNEEELFKRMPEYIQNMLLTEAVYKHIENCEFIYDQDRLMNELTFITDYDNYLNKKEDLKYRKEELKNLEENSSYVYLLDSKEALQDKIRSSKETCENLHAEILRVTDESKFVKDNLDMYTELKDIVKNKEDIEREFEETSNKIQKFNEDRQKRSIVMNKVSRLTIECNSTESLLRNYERSYDECKSLSKELKKLKEKYDDYNILKESLSSKDGIPLLFIKLYLQNAKQTVNDLLDQVYGGKMYITKFDIDATEFNIPFMKDNEEIEDIRYASQGETSFFSIALSFAISYQSMSKYNIMLLDELDSVLDESKRENYISIIVKQMEKIHAEQLFAISHNNMFSMYPVDLISVVDNTVGYGKLTNLIEIERQES